MEDMIFNVVLLIEFFSGSICLVLGIVILIGILYGVGLVCNLFSYLKVGDVVSIEIDYIGWFINFVIEEFVS